MMMVLLNSHWWAWGVWSKRDVRSLTQMVLRSAEFWLAVAGAWVYVDSKYSKGDGFCSISSADELEEAKSKKADLVWCLCTSL